MWLLLLFLGVVTTISKVSSVNLGDVCTKHTYCNYDGDTPIPNSRCDSGTCQCISTYYGETGDDKCVQATLGGDCSNATDQASFCLTASLNSSCTVVNGEEVCACDPGSYQREDKKSGEQVCGKIEIGSRCDPQQDGDTFCQGGIPNGVCRALSRTCQCPVKTIYVQDTGRCEPLSYDPSCSKCRASGGYCYDLEDDGTPTGCTCIKNRESSAPTVAESLNVGCDRGTAELGEYCDMEGAIKCRAEHSKCVHSGGIARRSVCVCDRGYVGVRADNTLLEECWSCSSDGVGSFKSQWPTNCDHWLSGQTDPNCEWCSEGGGFCYDIDGDKVRDGCVCPASRSTSDPHDPRNDCDTNHVTVQCGGNTMTLCYVPHNTTMYPNMAPRLANGLSYVYIHNRYMKETCIMEQVPGTDNWCVTLPIEEDKVKTCGTSISYPIVNLITYQNWMILQLKNKGRGPHDVLYHTYCRYDTIVKTFTASGSEVIDMAATATEGKEIHPVLEMNVYDEFRRDATTQGVRLGQPAMLEVKMTDNKDVYNSIRPEICIATNRPELANPATESLLILFNACPVEDSYLDLTNMFYPDPADPEVSQTGLFPMFRFEDGDFVFFHCAVRVCREVDHCKPANCSTSRKRRSLEIEALTDELPYSTGDNTYMTSRGRRAVGGRSTSLEQTRSEPVRITTDEQVVVGDLKGNDEKTAIDSPLTKPPTKWIAVGGGVLLMLMVVGLIAGCQVKKNRRHRKDVCASQNTDAATGQL